MAKPLADKLRPNSIGLFCGQEHLLCQSKPLLSAIKSKKPHSFILWGPPGCGKTTLARIAAQEFSELFFEISAVNSGSSEIKTIAKKAQEQGGGAILFIDEIHRFGKVQQDMLLPLIEQGIIFCIGATTQNPSFAVSSALLSRMQVYSLEPLSNKNLLDILQRAEEQTEAKNAKLPEDVIKLLLEISYGDARKLLNFYEIILQFGANQANITADFVRNNLPSILVAVDDKGDNFYELSSAFHKSLRSSDVDASLYWLLRMLEGGVDILYIVRRLTRIASEEIGNADPRALQIAINAFQAQKQLGKKEGELILAQATIYLAAAPKSNASYMAYKMAKDLVKKYPKAPVPLALRNPTTKLMEQMKYGENYKYDHNFPDAVADNKCFPDGVSAQLYQPTNRGLEAQIGQKLNWIKEKKKNPS